MDPVDLIRREGVEMGSSPGPSRGELGHSVGPEEIREAGSPPGFSFPCLFLVEDGPGGADVGG